MIYQNQKFLVMGLKKSGIAAAKFLLKKGSDVTLYDDDFTVFDAKDVQTLVEKGAKIPDITGDNEKFYEVRKKISDYIDIVVVSPGVKIDHPFLVHLKKQGKYILGELELAYLQNKAPIIAITGTNGKTTVSTLIHEICLADNREAFFVGNVGEPFIKYADDTKHEDVVIAEVSSFQLESVKRFTPHIGVLLNISDDHIDRHYNMENYIYLKNRLFKNQTKAEYAVLNYDDLRVRSLAADIPSNIVWFSKTKTDGVYLDSGDIYYYEEKILSTSDIALKGSHNLENILAAVAVCKILGVKSEVIAKTIIGFQGVKYRLALMGDYKGVTYYNDSKSTNCECAIKGALAMDKKTVILLGGKDKNQDFIPLFTALKNNENIKQAILFGESAYKMLSCAQKAGFLKVTYCQNLENAVKIARITAEEGDAVLFSPAAASFDSFDDYIKRGEYFTKLVESAYEVE